LRTKRYEHGMLGDASYPKGMTVFHWNLDIFKWKDSAGAGSAASPYNTFKLLRCKHSNNTTQNANCSSFSIYTRKILHWKRKNWSCSRNCTSITIRISQLFSPFCLHFLNIRFSQHSPH